MTNKRKSKSSVVRAKVRRRQPTMPAPKPAPNPAPVAPKLVMPAQPAPAPSPVVTPKVTPTPAPSPVAPKAPAQWKGWVVLVAVIVGIVFIAASLVNRSRQQVAQATPTAKVAAAAPTVESTATPVATSTVSPKATATPIAKPTEVDPIIAKVELGVCTKEESREARLDCATKYYFDFGQKLTGIKAYMRSLGAEWNEIKIGDPFQPSADALQSGSPRIWGAVLKAIGLKATGNSCLVTDVPSRVKDFKWVFLDTRYNPKPSVGHYGEAVTIGNLIEIAFHGDCSDWSEIRQAAQAAGYTLK